VARCLRRGRRSTNEFDNSLKLMRADAQEASNGTACKSNACGYLLLEKVRLKRVALSARDASPEDRNVRFSP